MSQKAITIQTPDWEIPHITADDDAFIYASLAGVQSGILGDLTCVKVDNNTVRLSGGGVMNRGHILRIPAQPMKYWICLLTVVQQDTSDMMLLRQNLSKAAAKLLTVSRLK